jgi:hypothetical protein
MFISFVTLLTQFKPNFYNYIYIYIVVNKINQKITFWVWESLLMSQNYKTEWSHYTIHREMKDEVTGEERKAEKWRGGKEMRE